MSDTIFGVDLGTTNSVLALMEDGGPRVVPAEEPALQLRLDF